MSMTFKDYSAENPEFHVAEFVMQGRLVSAPAGWRARRRPLRWPGDWPLPLLRHRHTHAANVEKNLDAGDHRNCPNQKPDASKQYDASGLGDLQNSEAIVRYFVGAEHERQHNCDLYHRKYGAGFRVRCAQKGAGGKEPCNPGYSEPHTDRGTYQVKVHTDVARGSCVATAPIARLSQHCESTVRKRL